MEARERELDRRYNDVKLSWLKEMYKQKIDFRKICVFPSAYGGGHARAIIRQLLKIRHDLKIVWLTNDLKFQVDDGISLRLATNGVYEYEYRTSGIWFGDIGGGFPSELKKRENQVGIELKHWSSVTLKKFYLDEKMYIEDRQQRDAIKKNIAQIDYVMVGSKFDEETCRSGLGFDGKYVYVGSPRSDILFRNDRKCIFFKQYAELMNKRLLLYAPTFRRVGDDLSELSIVSEFDYDIVHRALNKKFGGEWHILLRLHPLVAKESKNMILPNYVHDFSFYPDVQELVAASDAVITDYSSIMFEPAYINIPVFLFATDLNEYTSKERDFYIEYETLPFPIAKNNEELEGNILGFDGDIYSHNVASFFDKYGVHEDGHAAERAAKFISDLIDKKVAETCL